jgi:tripartite-type tricarboxylate transporter receptor subunit TctC
MLRRMVGLSMGALLISGLFLLTPFVPCSWGEYPERPITVIVPFAPGASDRELRTMTPMMGDILGQPIMVENREGGGGSIGTFATLQSRHDGYTLLFGGAYVVILNPLVNKVPYTVEDFIPIACTSMVAPIVGVSSESPWKTIQEFIDYGRKNPGVLKHGTSGVGSMAQLQEAALAEATGMKTIHVPFKGGAEVNSSIIGRHIDFCMAGAYTILPLVKGGKIRPLVTVSKKRHPDYPDTPTVAEVGIPFPSVLADTHHAFFAPKGTPPAICDKLTETVRKTLSNREVIDNMRKAGNIVEFYDQKEMKDQLMKQFLLLKELTAKLGLQKK